MFRTLLLGAVAALSLSACAATPKSAESKAVQDTAAPAPDAALSAAVSGVWRSEADKARDGARRPAEVLAFWGLKPGAVVLEIAPGGGYWTDILAPHAKATGGKYLATAADISDPQLSEGARRNRANFEARLAAKPDVYGDVGLVNFGAKTTSFGAPGSADLVLTARNVHNFMAQSSLDRVFSQSFAVLKPGGVLAIEEHRANPGAQDPKAENGYVTEAFVIEAAERAGFRLAGRSELLANPKDTKDHPFGVWTLPPVKRTAPQGQPANPAFDRTRYDAIGESDRMALKFVKPS